ncbi:hypothetical protein Tco_0013912 [Tanacetum coccineum]
MLAPSGGGLILYQAYGNLCAMTGRKAHLLEDKKIPSVGVFDEVSFYTLFRVRRDGAAGIKRRRHDLYNNGIRNLTTTSGRGRLKEDLESSTWQQRIKLLGHTMKLWERVIERKLRRETRVSKNQIEIAHNEEVDIGIRDKILQPNESFRYLGSMIHESRMIDEDASHRIKSTWLKWRAATCVICEKYPSLGEGKFYRVVTRPTMLYGSECLPIIEALANMVEVAELRMLSSRRRGRPKLRWEDMLKNDMKELLLSKDMTSYRNEWRPRIRLVG